MSLNMVEFRRRSVQVPRNSGLAVTMVSGASWSAEQGGGEDELEDFLRLLCAREFIYRFQATRCGGAVLTEKLGMPTEAYTLKQRDKW